MSQLMYWGEDNPHPYTHLTRSPGQVFRLPGAEAARPYPKLSESQAVARVHGLGLFHLLSDRNLFHLVFRRLANAELVAISGTSRAFYTLATDEDMWKKRCIRKWGGAFVWKGTWKCTCMMAASVDPGHMMRRLFFPSIWSPVVSPKFARCSVPMHMFETERNDVPRRSVQRMTLAEFKADFDKGSQPVIITDAMQDWPAFKSWCADYLTRTYGDCRLLTDEVDSRGDKLKMRCADYFRYYTNNMDEDPIYLFDPKVARHAPGITDEWKQLPLFAEDFFAPLSKEERPFYQWIVVGPRRSGSCFHLDPYNTSAWNAVFSGRKRWCFYPPDVVPPGVVRDSDGDWDAPEPMKWILEVYPWVAGTSRAPLEVVQEGGEIIWVPSGWWHYVLNLTDTYAVTQNVCNTHNFPNVWPEVLKEPKMTREMISLWASVRPDLFPPGSTPMHYFQPLPPSPSSSSSASSTTSSSSGSSASTATESESSSDSDDDSTSSESETSGT